MAKRSTTKEFIEKSIKIFGDTYDYSKVNYLNNHTKVCIICSKHGEFWQKPNTHLSGHGCPICRYDRVYEKCAKTTGQFIEESRIIHGDKYDYSKSAYINKDTHLTIICPEHGEFIQTPHMHLQGHGCPFCRTSHIETELNNFLKSKNINFVYQYRNKELFGKQSLDFFLPQYNAAIECQSEIHYASNFFKSKGVENAKKMLKYRKSLDKKKRDICRQNNIQLIYFMDKKFIKYEKSGIPKFYDKSDIINYIVSLNCKKNL